MAFTLERRTWGTLVPLLHRRATQGLIARTRPAITLFSPLRNKLPTCLPTYLPTYHLSSRQHHYKTTYCGCCNTTKTPSPSSPTATDL